MHWLWFIVGIFVGLQVWRVKKVTMIKNLDERQLKIVPSVMKLGKKSVRTLDGGDPRSVFSRFKEGEIVVVLTKKEYESMKSVMKNE